MFPGLPETAMIEKCPSQKTTVSVYSEPSHCYIKVGPLARQSGSPPLARLHSRALSSQGSVWWNDDKFLGSLNTQINHMWQVPRCPRYPVIQLWHQCLKLVSNQPFNLGVRTALWMAFLRSSACTPIHRQHLLGESTSLDGWKWLENGEWLQEATRESSFAWLETELEKSPQDWFLRGTRVNSETLEGRNEGRRKGAASQPMLRDMALTLLSTWRFSHRSRLGYSRSPTETKAPAT